MPIPGEEAVVTSDMTPSSFNWYDSSMRLGPRRIGAALLLLAAAGGALLVARNHPTPSPHRSATRFAASFKRHTAQPRPWDAPGGISPSRNAFKPAASWGAAAELFQRAAPRGTGEPFPPDTAAANGENSTGVWTTEPTAKEGLDITVEYTSGIRVDVSAELASDPTTRTAELAEFAASAGSDGPDCSATLLAGVAAEVCTGNGKPVKFTYGGNTGYQILDGTTVQFWDDSVFYAVGSIAHQDTSATRRAVVAAAASIIAAAARSQTAAT
jgi:hypothetical protein